MKQGGMIQHQTFLEEVKRRGLLADEVDPQVEIDGIGEESANELPEMTMEGSADQDDDED